jgi:catechol 2,3-dioxygenase-like lactoylglutathione lyase family enzyme
MERQRNPGFFTWFRPSPDRAALHPGYVLARTAIPGYNGSRSSFGKGVPPVSNKIYHIAVKVPDIDKAKVFYKNLFGFEELKQSKVRDHTSCHLTDGVIDLAIIQYDSEESPEAGLSGDGPCIHHFGVEVDDLEVSHSQLKEMGCEILSKPGVLPIKFRSPFGVVAEISPTGYFDTKHKNG